MNANHAAFTRSIHDIWIPGTIDLNMEQKSSNVLYHSISCGHSDLRFWGHKIHKCHSPLCRHGCNSIENADHVLLACNHVNNERTNIRKLCDEFYLQFQCSILLTHTKLRKPDEKLLRTFFTHP